MHRTIHLFCIYTIPTILTSKLNPQHGALSTMSEAKTQMCLFCLHSDFNRSERVALRLTGKEVDFECLHHEKYHIYEYFGFKKASQHKNNCAHYEPCPESLV